MLLDRVFKRKPYHFFGEYFTQIQWENIKFQSGIIYFSKTTASGFAPSFNKICCIASTIFGGPQI